MTTKKLFVLGMIVLAGCYQTEMSPEKRELGRVEQLTYTPSNSGSGVGVSMSGKMVVTSTTMPEQWVVVFSCPHGKFHLNPNSADARRMYERLTVGDSVTITYREEWHIDNDGGRVLADLDFVDAVRREVSRVR